MKNILFILVFLVSMAAYSQGGPKVDVIKFRGEVTSTIRDTFDVPTGETWLIWNTTTDQLEHGDSAENWSGLLNSDGSNSVTGTLTTQSIRPDGDSTRDLGEAGISWETFYVYDIDMEPTDTEPGTEEGMLYWDDSENTLKQYNGSAWEVVGGSAYLPLTGGTLTGLVHQNLSGSTYFGLNAGLNDDFTANNNTGFGSGVLSALTTGIRNVGIGKDVMTSNLVGTDNIGIGNNALDDITGSYNIGIGTFAMRNLVGSSTNIGIGYNAGERITGGSTPLTIATQGLFIGNNTRSEADSSINEIVIGHDTTGNGNNTVTIGNTNITETYLEGTVNVDDIQLLVTDTEPTATEGALYWDDSENTLKQYNGSVWEVLAKVIDDVAYASGWDGDSDATSKNSIWDAKFIQSDTLGTEVASARQIENIVSMTQADYDLLTGGQPDADWMYVITDAKAERKFIIPLGAVGEDIVVADDLTHIPVLDAITITRIEGDLLTAPTGSGVTFDIELDDGTPASIFSTLLTVDATERFSSTAATPAVISDATIPADSFLTFNIDVIGSTIAGKDATITIYYTID